MNEHSQKMEYLKKVHVIFFSRSYPETEHMLMCDQFKDYHREVNVII